MRTNGIVRGGSACALPSSISRRGTFALHRSRLEMKAAGSRTSRNVARPTPASETSARTPDSRRTLSNHRSRFVSIVKTASSAIDAPRCENGLTVSTAVSPVVSPRTGGREGEWIHAMATNSLLQQMDGVMMVVLISYVVRARALGV